MSPFRLSRCVGIAIAIGVVGASFSLPVLADSPIMVRFQANNPWTQEVGSVDRYHDSHDYSVQVAAGKTLQINLVTRDPNVFFKIRNETTDKQLVDTFKTGATTWSTQNATAATYTIHVYVDPEAMQRGEEAKYALQIGQYGAADMQPASTTVTFKDDNPWAQEVSSVNADATAHDYTVAIAAGKTLQVNLISRDPNVHFKVKDQTGNPLVDTSTTQATTWSAPVAAATAYTIRVYVDPATMPPGKQAQYALQVGHYDTARPATAGSAATSSSTAPAMPASAASAATPASAGSAGY